jgi:general secretion pathway protein F
MILYKLFLSLSLIVRSKFQFQDALKNSKDISNNSFVKYQLNKIIKDINKGVSISKAFEDTNMFDTITLRLLLTAQQTNKMALILEDIQSLYHERLNKNIKTFTLFLEPTLILIIASIILWLVLAIMTPIWQLSSVLS